MGEKITHTKWSRQLRRLQSMSGLMHSKTTCPPPTVAKERQELWQSIKDAAGFPGGFANVWKHWANIGEGSPLQLPRQVDIVDKIFKDFKSEFLQLEKTLIQARCKHAKEVRSKNNNAIYRDVAQPRSLPVSTVVADTNAIVSEVSVDGLTLKYAPADLQTVGPVNSTRGPLEIHTHEPGKIVLHAPQSIEPGDHLSQPKMLGDLPDVFEAFQGLWEPMWNKHANKPVEEWSPILQEIQATVPQPTQPMTLEPITAHQWLKAVQAKPDKSAVGPDGAHKRDLLHMPQGLVQQLVDCISELASVPNRSLRKPTCLTCPPHRCGETSQSRLSMLTISTMHGQGQSQMLANVSTPCQDT